MTLLLRHTQLSCLISDGDEVRWPILPLPQEALAVQDSPGSTMELCPLLQGLEL